MARAGRRYPLIVYTRMMDRWWPAALLLAVALGGLAWALRTYFPEEAAWRWMTLLGVAGVVLLFSLFFLVMRKAAYVQPRADHLRLVTPFLRLKISYKRIVRSSSTMLGSLFPPSSVSNWQREIIEPLANKTAVVVDLNAYPVSRAVLRWFLSPLFFKDKTPHLVLLVDDWMRFSSELESLRGGSPVGPPRRVDRSILSRLPRQ